MAEGNSIMPLKILVNGCSFTYGEGLDNKAQDLYINVFLNNKFPDSIINNIAIPGSSNQTIFENTVEELSKSKYDLIFVGWTSYPRNHFYFSFETYDYPGHHFHPSNIGSFDSWKNIPKEKLEITNEVLSLCHDHYSICQILKYSQILLNLHQQTYFINVLAHWSNNFFEKTEWKSPKILDNYTKDLLDVDNRRDDEIRILYNKMHNDYEKMENKDKWLNLYNSMYSFKKGVTGYEDFGIDGHHPGPISH